ncbi:DUF899 domain-containing protein [Rubinisphaera margarita]|uniref:DUF899 domain-containing protein n=1 Tax=Rubinisphaera margarita TaxID=2909586 RepID=UPI001EE7D5D4|nr:DUF899 domain-containing protein [Rubinisphaera margarita]MCG6157775.1 DUF899 domain-containing protein [Rubinisphaera margarita]
MSATAHPEIVSQEQWLERRKQLLVEEKELTKHYDRVTARRRRLPMVLLEKEYSFQGAEGPVSLIDLFDGHRQLIVYHFMFDPEWDMGCSGCTMFVNALADLSMLGERDTAFVLISRAPFEKLEAYRKERDWNRRWVSSFGSDFNYDFHVTQDRTVVPLEYNFRTEAELETRADAEPWFLEGETHGLSVFFQLDRQVYHTYSTYGRGCESLTDSYRLLDTTPFGRQEDFEDSPTGWPQHPTYG